MKNLLVVSCWLLVVSLVGCATTGAQKTAQEPLHTESGAGITIWKIPIIGIGGWGLNAGGGLPSVIVHRYSYQAQPPALPYGTPPTPRWVWPIPVDYQTIYQSAWDDPTLVIFKNDSCRKIRIEIDSQPQIVLAPYGATADIHLGVGEHRVRLTTEKPTRVHGTLEVVKFFKIKISPYGRSQVIHIYD